ncbi:MAG TPA: arsenical pump-driving ATPase [Usitatibacter sp.]|nr:arsenical pump-driving ATPase [Usitatibacter sp.]
MTFLDHPTRNLFFTGKGGVGKTSTSCATAVALAERGRKVLLVSTDPASNLDEVFDTSLVGGPVAIAAVPGLEAMNVDPEAAAAAYRERVVGPYRNLLPADAVASIEEQLAGACTVEIAAFDEFAKLIGDASITERFDHIVFDTAPTGHTLRLLALPAAWSGFIGASAAGTSCLGPLQGMVAQRELYAKAVATLSDAASTTMVLVSRPESGALAEAARTSEELAEIGVRNQALVLNGVFQAHGNDPVAVAMQRISRSAVGAMPARLASLARTVVPLRPRQVVGVEALRSFFDRDVALPTAPTKTAAPRMLPPIEALIDRLEGAKRGVVMTMGKGGVGKTTIAARIALELARRGHKVHLTTTDPAAHVAGAVGVLPPNLTLGEIDPATEVERYRDEVMATTGAKLDANGLALLKEDLSSPCTEEIAVFQAFAREVDQARDRFVVVDTAPTGHTILLLDAAQAFHREVMRQAKSVSEAVRNLLPRLRDPEFTRIVLCTLAEATPVHEAAALQADLRRASIEPFAWVVNQSLAPLQLTDPLLLARRAQEARYIEEVAVTQARAAYIVPWLERVAEGVRHAEAKVA